MTTAIFLLGLALLIVGVAQWSVPAAFVTAGLGIATFAAAVEYNGRPSGGDGP